LHQDTQHQQRWEIVRNPLQQYLSEQEFKKTGLSVQAPSLSNNGTAATVVKQILTELSGSVLGEESIMAITKMALTLMKQNGCVEFIGPSKS
jgi:type IV pilus biogenesis protein CpaD/CtpE